MKNDTQHLEFLISQYMDGSLDAVNRKFVEAQLASNPQARELLKDQRDVQDVLDDWGSRIPMIDWNAFDQKLAARLEAESKVEQKTAAWRRWTRPMAAAAALLLAAGIGYSWHAWTQKIDPKPDGHGTIANVQPETSVEVADGPSRGSSFRSAQVLDVPQGTAGGVQVQISHANPEFGNHQIAGTQPAKSGSVTAIGPTQPTPEGLPR